MYSELGLFFFPGSINVIYVKCSRTPSSTVGFSPTSLSLSLRPNNVLLTLVVKQSRRLDIPMGHWFRIHDGDMASSMME